MAKKETCPKCGKSEYAVATDKSNKHYCQTKGCGNIWVPGNPGMNRTDIKIKALTEENESLKLEIERVRKVNRELTAELETYRDVAAGEPAPDIFD